MFTIHLAPRELKPNNWKKFIKQTISVGDAQPCAVEGNGHSTRNAGW